MKGTTLTLSNALWLQKGPKWQQPFLDSLKKWYGAGARLAERQPSVEVPRD